MPNLIIGSRGSKLALWQANWIKCELERLHDGLTVGIEIIKTTGDHLTEASLSRMPGKGVFTKEIEEALFERRIDLAVHSLKDLPTTLPDGLHLAAITKREDPRDALIVTRRLASRVTSLETLPVQPRIGTSSPRRAAQIKLVRPDAQIFELRGNVETRLRKVDEGDFDAIILAAAGLNRLGFATRITQLIPAPQMLPAVGQGALGIETCIEDERTNFLLEALNHWPTRYAVEAERAVLRGLGGGCAVPIAAFGIVENTQDNGQLYLEALVCNVAGTKIVRHNVTGSQYKGEEIGGLLARHLIADGAYELLHETDDFTDQGESPAPLVTESKPVVGHPPILSASSDLQFSSAVMPALAYDTNEEKYTPTIQSPEITVEEPAFFPDAIEEIKAEELALTNPPSEEETIPPAVIERAKANGNLDKPQNGNGNHKAEPISRPETERPAPAIIHTAPLAGKRILVTRARHQADTLVHSLRNLGAEVIACPTIEIRPPESWKAMDQAIGDLRSYDWLAFTSSNGVHYFLHRFDELQHGRAELAALKVCAVGKKTADTLQAERIQVDLTPEKFTASDLASAFIKKFGVGQRIRGAKMLLPAAQTTRDIVRPTLEKIGVSVDVVEAYHNVLPDIASEEITTLIGQAQADYVIFTSPSTVNNLALLLDADNLAVPLANTRVACIGPVTGKAAEQCGLLVHLQPEEHTIPAIIEELIKDMKR